MAIPAGLVALIPDLIKKGVDLFDRKFESKAEKEQAAREFAVEMEDKIQTAWEAEQRNLTERHANDMQSDSWLSKNVRPLALVYLMALFTMAFFTDVPESVLGMLQDLLMTVFIFYFGARSLEKVGKMAASALSKQ
jgi:hypothetical protein